MKGFHAKYLLAITYSFIFSVVVILIPPLQRYKKNQRNKSGGMEKWLIIHTDLSNIRK